MVVVLHTTQNIYKELLVKCDSFIEKVCLESLLNYLTIIYKLVAHVSHRFVGK